MNQANTILCWNCRGAGSGEFLVEIKELKGRFRLLIMILLEPHISEEQADVVCRRIGKSLWVRSEVEGFSGGVWVLWDEEELEVELRYAHKFFLHFAVRTMDNKHWEFTAIYASPNATKRRRLWPKLQVDAPWLLLGDFNCVLRDEERSSQKGASTILGGSERIDRFGIRRNAIHMESWVKCGD